MYQVLDIMNEYFEDTSDESGRKLLNEKKLPVKTQRNRWEYEREPERLVGEFAFKTADSYAFFISHVAELEKKLSHHGVIVCQYPTVNITVRTHSLEMVTKSDINYTKRVLEVYRDAVVLERET